MRRSSRSIATALFCTNCSPPIASSAAVSLARTGPSPASTANAPTTNWRCFTIVAPLCRTAASVFSVDGAIKIPPVLVPDCVRVPHHDGNLHVVGEANSAAISIPGRKLAADLVRAQPAAAGGRRKNNRPGFTVAFPFQDQRHRIGLNFVDLFKPVSSHDGVDGPLRHRVVPE